MTIEDKVAAIVDRLLEKTLRNEIKWEQSFDGNFRYSFPDSSVEICREEPADGAVSLGVILYDGRGRQVDILWADRLNRRDELDRLFALAKKDALGLNEMVDTMLADLQRAS